MSAAVKERPDTKEQEKKDDDELKHAFCMLCNWGRENIVSICGAYTTQRKGRTFMLQPPPGNLCVVCCELIKRPCPGCGLA